MPAIGWLATISRHSITAEKFMVTFATKSDVRLGLTGTLQLSDQRTFNAEQQPTVVGSDNKERVG
jgi:hypothetical protein